MTEEPRSPQPTGIWLRAALFALAYFACAMLSRVLAAGADPFVTVWLPSGVYVAVLLRHERRHWPALVLAAAIANIGFDLWNGRPPAAALLFWMANGVEAIVGALLVRACVAQSPMLSTTRQVAGFLGCSALVSTFVGAVIGVATVATVLGRPVGFPTLALWWTADMIGVVLVAPIVLTWRRPTVGGALGLPASLRWGRAVLTMVATFALLVIVAVFVFNNTWNPNLSVRYLLLPFVILVAIRYGAHGASLASVTVAVVGLWFTARGADGIADTGLAVPGQIAGTQLFLVVVAGSALFAAAEAERHSAHVRLRAVFDGARDAIVIADVGTGIILDVNAAATEMLGRPHDELVGSHQASLHPAEDAEAYRKRFHSRASEAKPLHRAAEVVAANGRRIPVEVSASTVTLDVGRKALVGIFRDMSDRNRVDAIMEARTRVLQCAVDHSLEEVLVATLDEVEVLTASRIGFYHFLEADQQTLALQAWSTRTSREMCQAEGKGRHYDVGDAGVWVDCIHQRRPVLHNDYSALPHRKNLPDGHAPVDRELVVPIFRGDLIVAVLGVGNKPFPYTDMDVDTVTRLADLAWDAVERKRAEDAARLADAELAETRTNLRLALDGAELGTYSTNLRTGGVQCDDRYRSMLGYGQDDAPATREDWFALMHPDDLAVLEQHSAAMRLGQLNRYALEYRMRHKTGHWVWIQDRGRAIEPDDRGLPTRAVGTHLDVTRRKLLDAERQASRERLEKLSHRLVGLREEASRELARELHDRVGQNLTALNLNLTRLQESLSADDGRTITAPLQDSFTLVSETMEHVRDVIADLRPPVLDDYGLAAALRWHGGQFAQRTGLATTVKADEVDRSSVEMETALFRIAQEALTNVARHASAHRVVVTLKSIDGALQLHVSDDGVGFDTAEPTTPGCWGQMTMNERAESVGGRFSITSIPGHGTTVMVTVPSVGATGLGEDGAGWRKAGA